MMPGSWSFYGSFMIPVTLCNVIFAERQAQILLAKPKFVTGKNKFKHGIVYHNKSLKHKKMFKYGKPIQGMKNYFLSHLPKGK